MRLVRVGSIVFAACLVLACTACSSSEATTDEEATDERAIEEHGGDIGRAVWGGGGGVVGRGIGYSRVDHGRVDGGLRSDVGRSERGLVAPGGRTIVGYVEVAVDGSKMTMDTGVHMYTGTLTTNGDDWTYDAVATYADDGGTWTSHIVVEGQRQGDDAFTAEEWGEISSDEEGTLYVATWNVVGMRAGE